MLSVFVVFIGSDALASEPLFLSCFSKETLNLVKAIIKDRSFEYYFYPHKMAFPLAKDHDLKFKNIAVAEREAESVACRLTAIDKQTDEFLGDYKYHLARTNMNMPYVRVYFPE